jgi:hypothetical protein
MPAHLSRRSFLVAGASAAVVTACSSGKGVATSGSSASGGSSSDAPQLVTFSDASALVPGSPQRLTLGVTDREAVSLANVPDTLLFDILHEGESLGAAVLGKKHSDGIPRPYYPVEFTPPSAGAYTIVTSVNGSEVQVNVQIPASTTVVGAGQQMVPLDTPTTADLHGVELLCTRTPACPLHDITLREALASGQPVAFIVSTPKYCQIAICGPVLDVLLAQRDQFPQIKMLHAEVYPSDADAQPPNPKLTEAVTAYNLTFEPALYLARPDGTIMKRIDTIFDGVELHDALTQLAG